MSFSSFSGGRVVALLHLFSHDCSDTVAMVAPSVLLALLVVVAAIHDVHGIVLVLPLPGGGGGR